MSLQGVKKPEKVRKEEAHVKGHRENQIAQNVEQDIS